MGGWGGMRAAASLFSRKRQKLKNKAPTPIPNPSSRPFGSGKKKKKKKGTCECWLCWNGRASQTGGERESCCVYICKAAGRQQRVRLRLWPNLSSSLLPQTHQSSKTGPSRPRRTLGGTCTRGRARTGAVHSGAKTQTRKRTNIADSRGT